MGGVGRGRGREVGEIGKGVEDVRAPEEALAVAVEVRGRVRCVGEVGAEDASAGVFDNEHEAATLPAVLVGLFVEGCETDAVLLQAVHEAPLVDEL